MSVWGEVIHELTHNSILDTAPGHVKFHSGCFSSYTLRHIFGFSPEMILEE